MMTLKFEFCLRFVHPYDLKEILAQLCEHKPKFSHKLFLFLCKFAGSDLDNEINGLTESFAN